MTDPRTPPPIDEPVVVWTTWPDAARAAAGARMLVERRLAACVVTSTPVRSVYRWQGEVEEAEEVVTLAKTTRTRADAVLAALREIHPYEVPALLVLPVAAADPAYAAWIASETAST